MGQRLLTLASLLVIWNLVLQGLDWISSFVGYSRGVSEVNGPTLLLWKLFFDNLYFAISVEKAAYIAFYVCVFMITERLSRMDSYIVVRYFGLAVINILLLFSALIFTNYLILSIVALRA